MERTRNIFLAIVFGTLLIMLLLLTVETWANRRRGLDVAGEATALARVVQAQYVTLTAVAQYTPPPPTPLPTATPDRVATLQQQAQATGAADAALLTAARSWPLALFDAFDDNANGWAEGEGNPELSTGARQVIDSAYVWDLTAVDGFSWVQAPPGADYGDFFLAADVLMDTPGVGEQHLAFRYNDGANYYTFGVCGPGGYLHAQRKHRDEWTTLLPCTPHPALNATGVNRLAVIAQGDRFLLFANDVPAGEFRDDRLPFGRVGVQIEMDEGDVNVYRFDNFELRVQE